MSAPRKSNLPGEEQPSPQPIFQLPLGSRQSPQRRRSCNINQRKEKNSVHDLLENFRLSNVGSDDDPEAEFSSPCKKTLKRRRETIVLDNSSDDDDESDSLQDSNLETCNQGKFCRTSESHNTTAAAETKDRTRVHNLLNEVLPDSESLEFSDTNALFGNLFRPRRTPLPSNFDSGYQLRNLEFYLNERNKLEQMIAHHRPIL